MASQSNPAPRWVPVERDYEKDRLIGVLKSKQVTDHPLSESFNATASAPAIKETTAKSAPPKVVHNDPLSAAASDPLSAASSDPLSKASAEELPNPRKSVRMSVALSSSAANLGTSLKKDEDPFQDESFEPWSTRKVGILAEYTTNEAIGISASFIEGADAVNRGKQPVDRSQQRLAELEQSEENQTLQLSQKDYEKHIEKLHDELIKAWNNEERVKSLKIAIQCAKLLADVSVVKFYPSKFVMVTEILDTFGKLVYERIASRDDGKQIKFSDRVVPGMVSEQAKETCRNWFYKIASIRELLPRMYVEMAIIKSYAFIMSSGFSTVINRIARMIRGIGDPLVAAYARTYLSRKGHEVEPGYKDYLLSMLYDDIFLQKLVKSEKYEDNLKKLMITLPEYLHLFSPSFEWQLSCIGHRATQETLNSLMEKHKETSNPIILKHIMSSFPPHLISPNAKNFILLIRESNDTVPKHVLYTALGKSIVQEPPQKELQLPILNEIWKTVTKLDDPKDYLSTASVYIEYPLKVATSREVNTLLGDILRHVKEGSAFERLQSQLRSVMDKVLKHYTDFGIIFGMDNFLPFLDLFTGDVQIEVSKSILTAFSKTTDMISDPIIINTLFTVGKTVHDTINTLTFYDEQRQIARLISAFVSKLDFGMDFEKHLNFLVECRRAFSNLDSVKGTLVISACNLAMKTLRIVKGKHTKKTSAFIRACISYCFITIPSLDDGITRLQLYLLSGEVAMMNSALPQSDSLFKAAIKLIQEIPARQELEGQIRSTEEYLVSYINNFISLLIAVPGHPEQGAFYLVKGLLKVVSEYAWESSVPKIRIYLSLLSMFSSFYQQKLPYHFNGIDSNDVLYGNGSDYMSELQALINKVLEDTLDELQKLASDNDESALKNQSKLALDLFNYLLSCSELNTRSATLAVNLFTLAKKGADSFYINNSLNYAKSKEGALARELAKKLMSL